MPADHVLICARRGNRLNAPENTRAALISAYTAGADVLAMNLALTKDGYLVVMADPRTESLTGQDVEVAQAELRTLRKLDVSATFRPRGSTSFAYRPPGRHQVEIETFPELLDLLPADVWLLLNLNAAAAQDRRGGELLEKALAALADRRRIPTAIVASPERKLLDAAKRVASEVRTALVIDDQVNLGDFAADAVVVGASGIWEGGKRLTELGDKLKARAADGALELGAVVICDGAFSAQTLTAAKRAPFVWALSADSMLEVGPLVRPGSMWLKESFHGREVDTRRYALGYAKANSYAHVFQDDGVHVKIAPYDGPAVTITAPRQSVERQVQVLEERSWYALADWPFYSGGGLGVVAGLDGDFAAEVGFAAERACQATMLEMAVTNVDPARHQPPWNPDGSPRFPQTIHDKADFYNPHGAPPFVGAEHDEDDGYRINWNLGTAYDDNQYGHPVGDGKVLEGRLRLERRGSYFAAYYRNREDATDWVCLGAVRNDSMNPRIYLRLAGKRWRQELPEDPTQFSPIVPNEFVFSDLSIVRFPG